MKTDHLSEFEILDFQHNLLDTERAAQAERHLRECSMCRAQADHLQKQIAKLDSLKQPVSVPEPLIAGILGTVRKEKAVKETQFPDLRWFAGVAAAAAVLLIILNPHPFRKAPAKSASIVRKPDTAPAMETASVANEPRDSDLRQDVIADAPPPLKIAMDVGREEEKNQPFAFAAASKPAASDEPRVRVLAMSTIAPPADKPLMMGAMRAKRMRLAESRLEESASYKKADSSPHPAVSAPAEATSRQASPESFEDYTLSKELKGNETVYLLTVNNTNRLPICVSFSLAADDPSIELINREPGLPFTADAARTWRVDLTIPPLTNRVVRYQAIQH